MTKLYGPKRWFTLLAITASLCTIFLTNPDLLTQTLDKIDIHIGSEKNMKLANSETREFYGTADMTSTLEYCINPELLHYMGSSRVLHRVPLLPLDDHFVTCLTERQYQMEQPKVLNFGVFPETWNFLFDSGITNDISKCPMKFFGNCMIRHCDGIYLRLVKLERTPDFYTVPVCNSSTEISQLVLQLKPNNLIVHRNISLMVPFDLSLYQKLLRTSKFMECNVTLADMYKLKHPNLFKKNNSAIIENFDWIISIRNLLYSLRMIPMLAGGSLLGWRRECGIISFTHDFDFSVPIEQYNAGIEDVLKNHKTIFLKYKFGKPSDSLEYTLMDQYGTRADIFYLYEEKNLSWVGALGIGKQKIKYIYPPLNEICSTYLLGYLFHVPCNADDFIRADYGANWTEPNRGYRWYKYGNNNGLWSGNEWPDVFVKYF